MQHICLLAYCQLERNRERERERMRERESGKDDWDTVLVYRSRDINGFCGVGCVCVS